MGKRKGGNQKGGLKGNQSVGTFSREHRSEKKAGSSEGKKMSVDELKKKWTNGGNIRWPENYGFDGDIHVRALKSGTKIDRYGFNTGRFAAPLGTPYKKRSLFPGTKDEKEYHRFRVLRKVEVKEGVTAPWFDEPGGGTQYMFDESIEHYLKAGILKEI